MTTEEIADLRAAYDEEIRTFLATLHPCGHALYHCAYQTFREWCAEQGCTLPEPDFSDPYLGKRLAQYLAFREHELRGFSPESRAIIEPGFITFDRWLHGYETSLSYFGPSESDPIHLAPQDCQQ